MRPHRRLVLDLHPAMAARQIQLKASIALGDGFSSNWFSGHNNAREAGSFDMEQAAVALCVVGRRIEFQRRAHRHAQSERRTLPSALFTAGHVVAQQARQRQVIAKPPTPPP